MRQSSFFNRRNWCRNNCSHTCKILIMSRPKIMQKMILPLSLGWKLAFPAQKFLNKKKEGIINLDGNYSTDLDQNVITRVNYWFLIWFTAGNFSLLMLFLFSQTPPDAAKSTGTERWALCAATQSMSAVRWPRTRRKTSASAGRSTNPETCCRSRPAGSPARSFPVT